MLRIFILLICRYIFTTEGHLLPTTPQISMVGEHCSYFGAYCKSGGNEQESPKSDVSLNPQGTNASTSYGGQVHTGYPLDSTFFESTATSGLMKVSVDSFFLPFFIFFISFKLPLWTFIYAT